MALCAVTRKFAVHSYLCTSPFPFGVPYCTFGFNRHRYAWSAEGLRVRSFGEGLRTTPTRAR